MPMFPLYPARPEVFRQLLEALGEPTLLEVEIAVECGAVRALTALDMAERCVVRYNLKPALRGYSSSTASIIGATGW